MMTDTTPSLETVKEHLRNAAANGHTFEDWMSDQIADDMMAYSSDCEDADRDALIALIVQARREMGAS